MQLRDGQLRFSPTNLNGFLSCEHLTTLQLAVARDELKKPYRPNLHADLIRRKGDEHEAAYLARLQAQGRRVADDRLRRPRLAARRARDRRKPSTEGADVVYQAVAHRRHLARVRGLHRAPAGRLGYEVVDTKLARLAKPQHVLQLCFYTEQLARIQGALARGDARRHRARASASPSGPTTSSPTTGGSARGSSTRSSSGRTTYPYPVDFCGLCDFLSLLQGAVGEDDHLTLVAGMSRIQVERLTAAGITTLEALG